MHLVLNIKEQTEILRRTIVLINEMKVKSPKTRYLYKFQKGIMLSSQSLIGLFKMLKTVCNIDYIMTQKLNQDCLEHIFGCVRQISGPYEHPNAVSFKQRLRTLLLGKDISLVSSKSNITTEKLDKATYVSGCHTARDTHERELAIEVCLTTLVFKDGF